jgi:elongation factor 1 alpha-like protein
MSGTADAQLGHDVKSAVSGMQLVAAGGVVCHPEWPVPLVSRFAARILVLEPPIPVLQGQQVSKSK